MKYLGESPEIYEISDGESPEIYEISRRIPNFF